MNKIKPSNSEKLQSDVITYLRFVLTIGVILIHSEPSGVAINGKASVDMNSFEFYSIFRYLISDILARISVPLFFFISGFLFFHKIEVFNYKVYRNKLTKRLNSLLIPYFFWNIIIVIFFYIVQTFFPSYTSGDNQLIKDYSWIKWIEIFWTPINFPLWFVRDLIIVVIFSPIIYFCLKRLNFIFVAIMATLWFLNIGSMTVAFFFFSYGAYWSISRENFIERYDRFFPYSFVAYLVFAICDLFTRDYELNMYIHKIGIVGISALISLVAYGQKYKKLHNNRFLANSSFFIYVYHTLPLVALIKILVKFLQPQTDICLIIIYLICPLITIIFGLGIYKILIKYFPKFTSVITGSR